MKDRLELIRQGSVADAILHQFEPILESQEKLATERLKNEFRGGKMTEVQMAVGLARICAIADLRATLKSMSRKGTEAQEEDR